MAKKKSEKGQSKKIRMENRFLRYSGEETVSISGKRKKATKFIRVSECCKKECFAKVSIPHQKVLFATFYGEASKERQDALLSGFMSSKTPKTRRIGATMTAYRIWTYSVKIEGEPTTVCQKFFRSLYQVSEMRLRIVQARLTDGEGFHERRGAHKNRPRKVDQQTRLLLEAHLQEIPSRESQYARRKTGKRYFVNSDLNVKKIFELFQEFYKEKKGETLTNLSYQTYFKIFKSLNYGFRIPRTDRCDFCSECEVKLQFEANHPCKAKYVAHKARAEKYYALKKALIKDNEGINSKKLLLEFDYAQNLRLPKTNENSDYYKSHLSVYLFNVHCHNDGESFMFTSLETESKKNPSTVCSYLYNVINKQFNENHEEIVLFSDATSGQNKNHEIVTFCTWLSYKYHVKLSYVFPIRGHSFNVCDRNFALVSHVLKGKEKIETLAEYNELIQKAKQNPKPFTVQHGAAILKNWKHGFADVMKRKPTSTKTAFKIQLFCR